MRFPGPKEIYWRGFNYHLCGKANTSCAHCDAELTTYPDGKRIRENSGMIGSWKHAPEYIEGTEASTRFKAAMKQVLAVPHSVIQERLEQHRKEAAKNPNRPGPKPKPR